MIFDLLFVEFVMFKDIPDSGSGVVTSAGDELTIFEEFNLRNLFFMTFVPVHQLQSLAVPDANQLLFFMRNDD